LPEFIERRQEQTVIDFVKTIMTFKESVSTKLWNALRYCVEMLYTEFYTTGKNYGKYGQ